MGLFAMLAVPFLAAQADFAVTADANDQQWTSNGDSAYVGQTTGRVGSQNVNYVTGFIMPFLLPDLGGQSITNVSFDFTVTASNLGWNDVDSENPSYLDLVAPNAGAVVAAATSADDLSGTVLVDNYKKLSPYYFPNSTADHSISGGTLTSYLQGIYANDSDAAGKYVMLTLVSDTPITGGKYFTMSSGDASANQPTLNIQTVVPEPATIAMLGIGGVMAFLARRLKM